MNYSHFLNRVCNPLGLGALAAAQPSPGNRRFFQCGAAHWFKTGKVIFAVAVVLMASVWVSPDLRAAVSPINYTAGTGTVSVGGNVSVSIIVNSTLTPPSVNWENAGFYLNWDSSVLSLQSTSVNYAGSPLPLGAANFNGNTAGRLVFSWADLVGFGYPVPDGSTLFTVNFTAVGGTVGNSYPVYFSHVDGIGVDDSNGNNFIIVTPGITNGSVTVVPEPINWALGLFACAFIGSATARWASNRKMALQKCAQTASPDEPGA